MREDFDLRKDEIELYFSFLENLANDNHTVVNLVDGTPAYGAIESTEILKTFKANGFLLLYNLMESTVKNAVEAIFDDLQDKGVAFDSCRNEVRRVVLHNLRKWNVDRILPNLTTLGVDVMTTTFRKEEVFAGNVDARAIRDTARGYGFSHPGRKSDELLTVKTNRNDLAQRNKSFADVGRDYDIARLLEIKNEVVEYLEELIVNVDDYIAQQAYLATS